MIQPEPPSPPPVAQQLADETSHGASIPASCAVTTAPNDESSSTKAPTKPPAPATFACILDKYNEELSKMLALKEPLEWLANKEATLMTKLAEQEASKSSNTIALDFFTAGFKGSPVSRIFDPDMVAERKAHRLSRYRELKPEFDDETKTSEKTESEILEFEVLEYFVTTDQPNIESNAPCNGVQGYTGRIHLV